MRRRRGVREALYRLRPVSLSMRLTSPKGPDLDPEVTRVDAGAPVSLEL